MGFMLCSEIDADELNKQKDWSAFLPQQKYDGRRVQIQKSGNEIAMIPRSENIDPWKYPELLEGLSKMKGNFWIDGELCVLNNGLSDFDLMISRDKTKDKFKIKMLSRKYPSTFIAFDILELEGQDLRNVPLKERLKKLMELTPNGVLKIAEVFEDPVALYKEAMDKKWEGIIIKNKDSLYKAERSADWIKIKRKEFVKIKFTKYDQNPKGIRLSNEEDIAVQCAGAQSVAVRNKLDKDKYAMVLVSRLGGRTFNGKHRQPTFVELLEE
jgi:ATP-dependent DNA ligase